MAVLSDAKIRIENVSKTYISERESLPVLDSVSLYVKKGEFVSLLGPSGSGKSTLFKIAVGLIKPDQGKVLLNNKNTSGQLVKVGYMPQQDLLLPWKNLLDNAALPLIASGVSKKTAHEKVRELLPVFGLEGFENYYPAQLSGGMRQRAAFLRTFLIDSDIMLLDEPFAALDALTREKLQEWLLDIWGKFTKSVLFITHSIDEAIYLSDRVYVISDIPGKIKFELRINLARPRTRKIVTTTEFIEYKRKLMEAL